MQMVVSSVLVVREDVFVYKKIKNIKIVLYFLFVKYKSYIIT